MIMDREMWLILFLGIALRCDSPILEALNHFLENRRTIADRFLQEMNALALELGLSLGGTQGRPDLLCAWHCGDRMTLNFFKYHGILTVNATRGIEVLRLRWGLMNGVAIYYISSPMRKRQLKQARELVFTGFHTWFAAFKKLFLRLV